MKNPINIYDNVNLIFNTYTFLYLKLLLIIFMLLDRVFHARRLSKAAWMVEINGNGRIWNLLEIRKTIMAPKLLILNVHKLTAASTKMEVGKSRTKVAQWWSWNHQTKKGWLYERPTLILKLVYEICNV